MKKKPQHADICFRIGTVYRKKNDIDNAVRYFRKNINLSSNPFHAYLELGTLFNNLDQYEEALDYYLKAYAIDPRHAILSFSIAVVYQNTDRLSDAISYYQKAIELESHNAAFHYRLGTAYSKSQNFTDAICCYQTVLELEPNSSAAYGDLGISYLNLKKNDDAISCLKRAVELDPKNPQLHYYLGLVLMRSKQFDDAVQSYQKTLSLKPDYVNAYINVGLILISLGRLSEALDHYLKALDIDPENYLALMYFGEILRTYNKPNLSVTLSKHLLSYLNHPNLESMAANPASIAIIRRNLEGYLSQKSFSYDELCRLNEDTNGLLNAYLSQSINTNYSLEAFLTQVRSSLLELHIHHSFSEESDKEIYELAKAIGLQNFHNEYIWTITDFEIHTLDTLKERVKNKIDNNQLPRLLDLILIANYQSLFAIQIIKSWCIDNFDSLPQAYQNFLKPIIIELHHEQKLHSSIPQITSIDDHISLAVQSQYEESPYPRWNSLSHYQELSYTQKILNEIAPYEPELVALTDKPEILIAGCGTGKHPITTAIQCANSQVLAIDLSCSSLAYAQRKAQFMDVDNIKFGQADILKLRDLNRHFDVIECGGVLHHMEFPEEGLKVLIDILKPGGFLKLGLYSEIARQHIAYIRDKINYKDINPSQAGIRDFRQSLIYNEPGIYKKLEFMNDFYSTSALRDLLLHVQEHRFTVLQVKNLLNKFALQFLGFTFGDPSMQKKYRTRFPDDPNGLNLEYWHIFETENPNIFGSMYQFWCQKK